MMEISVETLINFLANEEKELMLITNSIKDSQLNETNRRVFNHINQVAEQNVQFFERLNNDLSESMRSIQIGNIELEDYQTPFPKKNKNKLLTILLFIIKSINNFMHLIEMLSNLPETELNKNTVKIKINEKEFIKNQVEKIYDQEILK